MPMSKITKIEGNIECPMCHYRFDKDANVVNTRVETLKEIRDVVEEKIKSSSNET